jgi:hypothetical protein
VNGQNTLGVDVLEGMPESDGLFDRRVALRFGLLEFVAEVGDLEVEFSFIHGVLPFFASRVAATLTPFLELSADRLRALMAASDLPNGEPSRMLNAFGSGQIFSSMFIEQ